MYTWIDEAYAVHSNMRSHTGGGISMGHGVLYENESVQRLNTKSSTWVELVGVSKYLPYNLRLMIFWHGQGYGIVSNILYQEKQITIRMDKIKMNFCTKKTQNKSISDIFCQGHSR